jgi:hypothetical protein
MKKVSMNVGRVINNTPPRAHKLSKKAYLPDDESVPQQQGGYNLLP